MRDIWYADNRDLVKWAVILHLAKQYDIGQVLQIAYYRDSEFGSITIDDTDHELPKEVLDHFRNISNIKNINSDISVTVFDSRFNDRASYASNVSDFLKLHNSEPVVVFLDPDTGLEPNNPSLNHVLNSEVGEIWRAAKPGDILVFYQHQTNRNGQSWIEPKRVQFADAINVPSENIKVAHGSKIARDVVFFYAAKV